LPNNLQHLLAFTLNGQRYSTGVNNLLLSAKELSQTPSQYQALSVTLLSSTFTGNTKVALGQLYHKVDNKEESRLPSHFLTSSPPLRP
jgi:hypothetical protein